MGFGFYRFFIFLADFFNRYFFWIVWFFIVFLLFFYRSFFWTVLVECGISRAISFLSKTRKSRKKSKKWRKKGSKKKGRSWTFLYHPHFWSKIVFFASLIAPLAGTFQKSDPLPRSCFYTVLVLVVGGVQSGDNFFRLFFQGPSCRSHFCAIDFRRWYNTRGGGGGGSKTPNFGSYSAIRGFTVDTDLTRGDGIYSWMTSFNRGTKTAFYRSCFIFGPLIGAATHERHSVDNR